MLKHVVVFAISLGGVTTPYAAEKAVTPMPAVVHTQISSPMRSAGGPSTVPDSVKQAWIARTLDRLLDTTGDAGSQSHEDP